MDVPIVLNSKGGAIQGWPQGSISVPRAFLASPPTQVTVRGKLEREKGCLFREKSVYQKLFCLFP